MEAAGKDSGDRSSAILIYTDGACFPNPSRGGWGVRIVHSDGTRDELQGSASGSTTSSRMEMTAVLMGLRAVTEADRPVIVRSDSQFVIRTLCGRYRRHKNFDLWKDTDREVARFSRIRFEWVRGHAGDVHNEAADKLAKRRGRASSVSALCSASSDYANSIAKSEGEARALPFALET
jgi:ribonuclease HI